MRAALTALTDELRRLKTVGVKSVSVSDESLLALRRVLAARKASSQPVAPVRLPAPASPAATAASSAPATKPYEPPAPPVATKPVAAAPTLPPPPKFVLPEGDKQTRWNALLALVQNDAICRARVRPGKKVVLGVGNLEAKIMFVGEAPGAEEEIQGEPFVGPAGQLLNKMIQAMALKRTDIYIGNIMNWRPDLPTPAGLEQLGNRPPTEEEIRYCLPYVRAQIDIVNPALIVALGKTAAEGMMGFGAVKTLGEVRGRWHEFAGRPLMVTYHPSYLLRPPIDNRKKRMVWDDLLKVMERAALPISERQRGYFLDK